MKYLSIDVETTSLTPNTGQLLEVAAVFEDGTGTPVDDLPAFRAVFMRKTIKGDPYALMLNAGLIKQIAEGSTSPASGGNVTDIELHPECGGEFFNFYTLFTRWLESLNHDGKFTIAGKNFWKLDYPFLLTQMQTSSFENHFSHRAIDPGSLYYNGGKVPSLLEILTSLGLKPRNEHTALGDVRDVVEVIRRHPKF